MSAPKFDSNTFKKSVLGFGAGAAALMVVATDTQAGSNAVCLPLKQVNGYIINANTTAREHSLKNAGVIAISAMPGADLRDNPGKLTNVFRGHNLAADCFINNSMFPNGGTMFSLYVAGIPVEYKGKTSFGIKQLRDTPEILRLAKTDAIIAKAALASNTAADQTTGVNVVAQNN